MTQGLESLMEDILDDEADSGVANPLSQRFMKVLNELSETEKLRKAKDDKENMKRRICAVLDASPLLTVNVGVLSQIEHMIEEGKAYQGQLNVGDLITGHGALNAEVIAMGHRVAAAPPLRPAQFQDLGERAQVGRAPRGGVQVLMDDIHPVNPAPVPHF